MSLHLYEIKQLYLDSLDDIEDPADFKEILDSIIDEFEDKGIAVISYFKSLEAESKAIKDAEALMKARRTTMDNKVAKLKDYLLTNMIQTGITKIECPLFKVSVRNNPESVSIINEKLIPGKYKITKTVTSIDKKLIKSDGGCPGVELVSGKSLTIK